MAFARGTVAARPSTSGAVAGARRALAAPAGPFVSLREETRKMPLEAFCFLLCDGKKKGVSSQSMSLAPPPRALPFPLLSPVALPPVQDRNGSSSGTLSKEKLAISCRTIGARRETERERDRSPRQKSREQPWSQSFRRRSLRPSWRSRRSSSFRHKLALGFFFALAKRKRENLRRKLVAAPVRNKKKRSSATTPVFRLSCFDGAIAAARFSAAEGPNALSICAFRASRALCFRAGARVRSQCSISLGDGRARGRE